MRENLDNPSATDETEGSSECSQDVSQQARELERVGFSQQQWRALREVYDLASNHPSVDPDTARIIFERMEKQFAQVRDRLPKTSKKG